MNIAVTGSAGFVGNRLCRRLEYAGHSVVPLDVVAGVDLTDWEQVKQTPSVDCVFHLAARIFVPASFEDPQSFYYTNLNSTLNALELCRKNNARFVYASSYVYGAPKYLPVDEKHPVGAHNPYAQSKLMGEQLCHAYWRDFSVPSCILRPFNIYGPGQTETFLIPETIQQARKGSISLRDARPKRDFIYVDDVVEAYVACLSFSGEGVEVFNIASGESLSIKDVAMRIANMLDCSDISFAEEQQRRNDVLDTCADISKAKHMLKWEPRISFDEGLRACL